MTTLAQTLDLAFRHHQGGNLQQAEELYLQILKLDPRHADALHLLGVIAGQVGRPDLAIAYIRQALSYRPNFAFAHNNLGKFLLDQGQLNEAKASFQQALRCKPDYFEAHTNLGLALQEQGEQEEAMASYRRALCLKPDYPEAHYNLGNILKEQSMVHEAVISYQEAIRLKPDLAEAHNNLGNALRALGRLEEGVASYREVIRLKPDDADAYNNLGLALQEQGNLEEAVACYQQALRLKPAYDEVHYNLGMILLLLGNFAEAWPEFEWRRQLKRWEFRSFLQPIWDGTSLHGKTILLYADQGFGDTLQFIRYAPLVKQQGGKVLFECPAELVRILQNCAGIDQILAPGSRLPCFNVQAPIMSLPAILKTTLDTVPASIPYLRADPALTERRRQELSKYAGFKIGIVWQGNPRFSQAECRSADQRRSISLSQFEPLARLPGVRIFSLQKGYGTEQLTDWKTRLGIVDLGDKLNDFMDTAAVMMNLDLIISSDTSPLHLAGALGRPVWAVLSFSACWRWLKDREDSPWYPTMRLFRQPRPGDWQAVFEQMADALRRLVGSRYSDRRR